MKESRAQRFLKNRRLLKYSIILVERPYSSMYRQRVLNSFGGSKTYQSNIVAVMVLTSQSYFVDVQVPNTPERQGFPVHQKMFGSELDAADSQDKNIL